MRLLEFAPKLEFFN